MANFYGKLLAIFHVQKGFKITLQLVANFLASSILVELESVLLPDVFPSDAHHLFLKTVEVKGSFVDLDVLGCVQKVVLYFLIFSEILNFDHHLASLRIL